MTAKKKHILVLRFSALGDVAMTLPVIYSAATAYPEIRFTVVTRPFFARLFIAPPPNVNVCPVDPKKYTGISGVTRLARELGRLRPTAVADLHNVLRTWLIDSYFRMRNVRVVMVNKKRAGRRTALRSRENQENFISRYVNVFKRLGLDFYLTFRSLKLPSASLPLKIEQPAVGVAPFARYYTKTYPPEMMRRVVEKLCEKGVNVYLFGARGKEAEILKGWSEATEGCHSVAGEFAIEEELALMSQMKAMVSMDSANQHLASLAGATVITIWGATTPECGFTPYRQDSAGWLRLVTAPECQPCSVAGTPKCPRGNLKCMYGMTPDFIASEIMKKIDK